MNGYSNILYACLWFLVLGGGFGLILAFASKLFEVKTDPRVEEITALLPGANCGGCGYAGCAALAGAITEGVASKNSCPASSKEVYAAIAGILGEEAPEDTVRMRAQVMCSGTKQLSTQKYEYEGIRDCIGAAALAGGSKMCPNGCIGLGTCASVCAFGAITVEDGVAAVDYDKCTACGACVKACPKNLIKLIPYDAKYWVGCESCDKGVITKTYCEVGCIGCKLCERACSEGAIKVENFNAEIDYSKCISCGKCEEACPRKIIWSPKSQKEDGIIRGEEDLRQDRGENVPL